MKRFECLKRLARRAQSEKIAECGEDLYQSVFWGLSDRGHANLHTCLFDHVLSCHYCILCVLRSVHRTSNAHLLGSIPRTDTMLSFFYFLPLLFSDIAVGRGATVVTSILSWKVLGNCQDFTVAMNNVAALSSVLVIYFIMKRYSAPKYNCQKLLWYHDNYVAKILTIFSSYLMVIAL